MARPASNVVTSGASGQGAGDMTVRRLAQIPGFSIDRVAAAAGDDPDVLRLENLDTDVAAHVQRRSGVAYDPDTEITITSGEGDAMLDALLCTTAVAALCRERDLWLIYVSWMEAILFDGRPLLHPA